MFLHRHQIFSSDELISKSENFYEWLDSRRSVREFDSKIRF